MEKNLLLGFGFLLFFGMALTHIFLYIGTLLIPGWYTGHAYYVNFDENLPLGGVENIYLLASLFLNYIGSMFFILMFERAIKTTKYIFGSIALILTSISLIIIEFSIISTGFNLYVMTFIIFWLSIKSSKKLQLAAIFLIIGSSFGNLAIVIRIPIYVLGIHPSFPLILILISGLFVFFPFFVNIETIKEYKLILLWIFLIVVEFFIIVISVYIIFHLPILFALELILCVPLFLIWCILAIYKIYKIATEKPSKYLDATKESVEKRQDIIKAFVKPKRVTEEEVSFSKEKKICLVCKGKLERKMYMCPDCSTFYCNKCSDTLSNLENACWVCETPFDKSKPVKLEEKETEKVKVEKINHKNVKKK
jgi:hypothetical protein